MNRDNQQERPATYDMGWVIGIFEGEGSVSLATGRHQEQVIPRISIANMDQAIIERVVEVLNNHRVPCYVYRKSDCTRIVISGAKRVKSFLEFVGPWVCGDKKLKCAVTLEWINSRLEGSRTKPYNQYQWWLFKTLRDLNGKAVQKAIDRKVAGILRDYTPDSRTLPFGMKIESSLLRDL